MIITIQIIKVYHVDTGEGDTTDPESVKRQLRVVETMPTTDIEEKGTLINVFTALVVASNAEVVGPSDVN